MTAYNQGPSRLSIFNKHVIHKSPGKYTKNYIRKCTSSTERYNRRRNIFKTSKRATIKPKNVGPDENYGNVLHDPFLELSNNQIKEYSQAYLDKLSLNEDQIKMLEARTRRQHQCEEWFIERKKRLVIIHLSFIINYWYNN